MDRNALGAIAIGIIILMGVVVLNAAFFGGIDNAVVRAYEKEFTELKGSESEVNAIAGALQKVMDQDQALRGIGEQQRWLEQVTESRDQLLELKERLSTEGTPLIQKNDSDDTAPLGAIVGKTSRARQEIVFAIQRTQERAQKLADFLSKKSGYLETAQADAAAIRATSFAAVEEICRQAQTDWPEKSDDIAQRLGVLKAVPGSELSEVTTRIDAQAAKHVSDTDVEQLLSDIQRVSAMRLDLSKGIEALPKLIGQLYVSEDKILTDMEARDGSLVKFFHQYQVIKVDRDNKHTDTKEWAEVNKQTFDRHKNNLGMTIWSKPKGLYNSEATSVAAPAGYNYVGNKHYGRWDQRGGSSFWVWYGQYSFMRNVFWGSNYNYYPVSRRDYNSYRSARTSGRTYYGPKNAQGKSRYGSNGTFASSRYKSSKYNTSYKKSQYAKTGGKYKGSRFSSGRSGRSSSSFRRGARSRGGSRSFGK